MKKAFTLVELIIVIAVIGVLAAILVIVIGNAVAKSNAKSALSDARNALTSYEAYMQEYGINNSSVLFIVQKKGGMYIYGLFGDGNELIECTKNSFKCDANNPFTRNVSDLLDATIADGTVEAEENTVCLNNALTDIPPTVAVYSGYRLCAFNSDLFVENRNIELAVGESEKLRASVSPDEPIRFSTDNGSIASVDEQGNIIGKAEGTATITAACGETYVEVNVTVTKFVEFYGTFEQFKSFIEETGTKTLYIRLMTNVATNKFDNLPLEVPADKKVRIDLNGWSLYCGPDRIIEGSPDEEHDSFIKNSGGTLKIENASATCSQVGFVSVNFDIDSSLWLSTLNNQLGELYVSGNVFISNDICKFDNAAHTFQIINHGKCIIDKLKVRSNEIHNMHMHYDPFIYNFEGAYLDISDSEIVYGGIVNKGMISSMYNTEIVHVTTQRDEIKSVVVNYGTILNIKNCTISNYAGDPSALSEQMQSITTRCALYSQGKIGTVENTMITSENRGNAFYVRSGEVGSIMNCEIYSADVPLVFESDAVLLNLLTDGKFSAEVDEELIRQGYICRNDGERFIIGKE